MANTDHSQCVAGSLWDGTPAGVETKLGSNNAYKVGDNPDVAILLIHDLFGWTFKNLRLLADYYAQGIGATVWMPDLCVTPSNFVVHIAPLCGSANTCRPLLTDG